MIFDLDDTLYSEKDYVRSSFRVVERMLPEVNNIFNKLCAALEKGQPPLETVLKDAGMYSDELLLKCREAIRDHKPEISLYEGVKELFFELHTQKAKYWDLDRWNTKSTASQDRSSGVR